jgi:hypothetical protein
MVMMPCRLLESVPPDFFCSENIAEIWHYLGTSTTETISPTVPSLLESYELFIQFLFLFFLLFFVMVLGFEFMASHL